MVSTLQVIITLCIVGGIWLYKCVQDCRGAWRGLGYKYGLKKLAFYIQMPIVILLGVYWVLITVSLLPLFIQYIESTYPATFCTKSLPMAYAVIIILVLLLLARWAFDPYWKLTDEEKEYEKIQRQKRKDLFNQKIATYPKFIRWLFIH